MEETVRPKLVIRRDKWSGVLGFLRDPNTASMCTVHNGRQCCLGHLINLLLPDVNWGVGRSMAMPTEVPSALKENFPRWMLGDANPTATALGILVSLNDDKVLIQELKEAGIAYVLWEMGYDVEFTGDNGWPPATNQ